MSLSLASSTWSRLSLFISSELLPDMSVELIFVFFTVILVFLRSQLQRACSLRTLKSKSQQHSCKMSITPLPQDSKLPVARPSDANGSQRRAQNLARFVEQVISTRLPAVSTLQSYEEMRNERKHLHISQDLELAGSARTAVDFYAALIQCAGRAGRAQLVEEMFLDMVEAGIDSPLPLFESAMKLLATKGCHQGAISIYKHMERNGPAPSATSMSCAINFACEIGEFDLAISIFDQLSAISLPSLQACMCVLRIHAKKCDWIASTKFFANVNARGVAVDSLLLNTLLSTGVSSGNVDAAAVLLSEEPGASVADVVSFNIILKGLAKSCEMERTIELLQKMIGKGIQPNLISFNTVLDATVRARRTTDTWRLYGLMSNELHVQPDKCTCSILVKTFVINRDETENRIELALELLEKVRQDCSDQLLQSLLSGCLAAALRLQPSLASLGLAKRAFAGLAREDRMLASTAELRSLLTAAASSVCQPKSQNKNETLSTAALLLLRFAWRHASPAFDRNLADAKRLVERRAEDGNCFASATLSVLTEGEKKHLQGSGASKKVHDNSSTARCSGVITAAPWRRPARAFQI